MSRLKDHWTTDVVDYTAALATVSIVAHQLAGLKLHENKEGSVLVFTDNKGRLVHVAVLLGVDNSWACFCAKAADGECAATSYARIRLLEYLED